MNIYNRVKKITYLPAVVQVVKFLHIRTPMRLIYYYLTRPKDSKKDISFCGINAQFHVSTPLELRMVETPFTGGIGDERKALEKLLDAINPADVIYDIGANIGVHTVFMAKKTGPKGKVVAIEPEANSYKSLKANIALNKLDNVEPIQIALGRDSLEGELYSSKAAGDFSLVNKLKAGPFQKTPIIPGDALVKKYNLPLPTIVKIDVEGYEYQIIEGLEDTLRQKECRNVLCEIHPYLLPKEINPDQCMELLRSYGFRSIEIYPRVDTLHAFCCKGNV